MIGVLIVFFLLLVLNLPRINRWYCLFRWKKKLQLTKRQQQFNWVFQAINGFQLSHQARKNCAQMAYTYGEIEFVSFIALLGHAQLTTDSIFCDLGSGIGKAVIATVLTYRVKQAIGIEILPLLHRGARQAKQNLALLEIKTAKKVQFIQGDFIEVIPADVTVVFINASAFFGELWQSILSHLDSLNALKTVVSTKRINSARFKLIFHSTVTMSWGLVDAWIYAIAPLDSKLTQNNTAQRVTSTKCRQQTQIPSH